VQASGDDDGQPVTPEPWQVTCSPRRWSSTTRGRSLWQTVKPLAHRSCARGDDHPLVPGPRLF
jgi:hypothetical protein